MHFQKFNTKENKLLILLMFIITLFTSYLIYGQTIIGVDYWDIFVYLQNAMLFSHINIGSQLSVAPILSLLTSIPFQLGFISETSLFVISGILFIFLVMGLYLLLNERFSPEISFVGSLLFSTLSLVVTWAVSGANDIPALSFTVWAVYFTIKGVKLNFKYYYLAYICFLLAFFTRFTEGFALLIMLFYLVLNLNTLKIQLTKNNLIKFSIFVVLSCILISIVYISFQGTIPFISQFFEVSSSSQVSTLNPGYSLNKLYYITNLPQLLTSRNVSSSYEIYLTTIYNSPTVLSYIFLLFTILGVIYTIKDILVSNNPKNYNYLFGALILILSIITIITYSHISFIITEFLFVIILLLSYICTKAKMNKLDLIMILWFGLFFILHSYHPVKVDRYIIPILIPLIYFMIIGIKRTVTTFNIKNKKTPLIILTILLLIMIPITGSYTNSIQEKTTQTTLEENAAIWLKEYDTNYNSIIISSDRGVVFSWYLKKYTYSTIPRVLEENNQTLENTLKSINAKYYIDSTSNTTIIPGYHEIYYKNINETKIKIYQKD